MDAPLHSRMITRFSVPGASLLVFRGIISFGYIPFPLALRKLYESTWIIERTYKLWIYSLKHCNVILAGPRGGH